ncbi:MAG: tripartite tricarboxylate transporter substrate binding protein [Burkholderiales bacterium]|nr:tripartite tricarboxylate transporter substrate binding protein [Burkholderiales bacterium]
MKTLTAITCLGAMLALAPAAATAQAVEAGYPSKPLRMVVPFGAGGVSDIVGRVLAQKMGEVLGQSIVVDNRPGAGGMVGAGAVAKSAPDGYTILLSSLSPFAIGPRLVKAPPYDPVADFSAIGAVALTPTILTVGATTTYKSVADLVTYARANPGKLNYGSSGIGSVAHISAELLRISGKVELTHVPYKTAAAAYPDMIAGSLAMVFDALPSAIVHVRSGKARPIAMMADKRSPLLPEVPTFAEAGYPNVTLRLWIGLHAPPGLPAPILQKISDAASRAVAAGDLRERFGAVGAEPGFLGPREFGAMVRQDVESLGKTIEAAGIKPE